ncbi:hypothetical protein EW146_g2395 [Bondarzewia mesenterica]|uniref:Histone deacetylase domain-containing protein n=1 Tax=Bondarzewia mesenterica TaxID=1095465 RepID=A0A4S4M0V6_9AGAM|nr:hypothetical protein EW146_g2395 [Bondarzewia mesenterica]
MLSLPLGNVPTAPPILFIALTSLLGLIPDTAMKVFYDPGCLLHDPPYEILSGQLVPYFESPARARNIKHELESSPSFKIIGAEGDLDVLKYVRMVHNEDYIQYLRTAYQEWVEDGGDKSAVLPETFPHPKLTSVLPSEYNPDVKTLCPIAKAGFYCFDLSCPITEATYMAITASARAAISAAKSLTSSAKPSGPESSVFALSRPPGHHAGSSLCGGYCFFNNVAIAVRFLQDSHASTMSEGSNPQGEMLPIAILDIDYHHGNGTQEIFYSDGSVLYVSLHAQNDYPYFTGSTKEKGSGEGLNRNINFPLPRGTTDESYSSTLRSAASHIKHFNPAYLAVRCATAPALSPKASADLERDATSLGVDTYKDDPISDFKLTHACYGEIGRIIARLDKPTLFVMEGGYAVDALGSNVRAVLEGFEGTDA